MESINLIHKEIMISGLKSSYRILHVTDVHIVAWSESDNDTVITVGRNAGKKLIEGFAAKRVAPFTKDGMTMGEKFAQLCDNLKMLGPLFVDVVVFTGDILDFYTDTAFDFMMEQLQKLPMPYMFVLGNHDYIFSNHNDDQTLARFAKLGGGSYKIQKFSLGELTLVGAFNGPYFYDEETRALVADAIRGEEHVLLFQHVPINSPSFAAFAKENCRSNVTIGAVDCPKQDDSQAWILQLLTEEQSPIRALICGDSHCNYSGPLTDRVPQHISPLFRDFPPVLFTVKGETL